MLLSQFYRFMAFFAGRLIIVLLNFSSSIAKGEPHLEIDKLGHFGQVHPTPVQLDFKYADWAGQATVEARVVSLWF